MIGGLSTGEKVGEKFFKKIQGGVELLNNTNGKVVVNDVVFGELGRLGNLVPIVLWSEGA